MEDVKEDIYVLKNDVDVLRIRLSSTKKDVKDVKASINNTQFCLEMVEDCVDGLAQSIQSNTGISSSQSHAALLEVQRVEKELPPMIEGWFGKLEQCNTIIDKRFIHLDEELEKVITLVREKIEAKFREFSEEFMGAIEIEEAHKVALEAKVSSLEENLEHTLSHVTNLAALVLSIQAQVGDLEDSIMEDSNDDAEGEVLESSSASSTDVEPVENMVVIPVLAPSVVHTLIPVKFPLEFIPLSPHSHWGRGVIY
jgi:chromosome segregation ATPase